METLELMKKDVETTKDSYRKIAERYDTNHTQVGKNIKKYGWDVSHRSSKKVSKPQNPHNKILGSIALRKIEELKEELGDKYSPIDEPLIVMYAKSYERYIELEQKITSAGVTTFSVKTGAEYLSPTFTASLAIQKNLVTIANQLGFSLASRKKLNINFSKLDEKQSSIFDFAEAINDNAAIPKEEGFDIDGI